MAFVSIREGRSPESIRTMISAVTAAIAESLDAPPESVRVVVTEVPLTHWATGDVTLAERAQAAGKQEQQADGATGARSAGAGS
jgi:4-oxalocrotonate tautomerase